jgi:hypothetical protein
VSYVSIILKITPRRRDTSKYNRVNKRLSLKEKEESCGVRRYKHEFHLQKKKKKTYLSLDSLTIIDHSSSVGGKIVAFFFIHKREMERELKKLQELFSKVLIHHQENSTIQILHMVINLIYNYINYILKHHLIP